MKVKFLVLCCLLCFISAFLGCGGSYNQMQTSTSGFQQTNLVSDAAGTANRFDPELVRPRGIAVMPGQPFWIADNNSGTTKVFGPDGAPASPLGIVIPIPAGKNAPSAPVGVIANPVAADFHIAGNNSQFLFATEDGTISGWSLDSRGDIPTDATLAIDSSARGAVYTGLAIVAPQCCREFLAVANFHSGRVEPYTVDFAPLATPGSFTDPNLPAGYAPFGIQLIGNQVFVTYALQDGAAPEPASGVGNGLVDIFDLEGTFVRRFVSNGVLNAPWGVAKASASFGLFSNAILIGNFGDGTINAFDPATGNSLGQLKDGTGKVITNPGLWALAFRNDGVGDPNTLYFTAGPNKQNRGLFGAISFHN